MKILLIVHGYPPDALGGTEIYTHDLAHALVATGAEVEILARSADPERPEHEVRREVREGLPVHLVNNTFRDVRSFEDVYRHSTIRRLAAEILDAVQPDVVHLQHITCLSTDLLAELGRRHLPTVFTLNDYWLLCQRGQLFDLDYQRCDGPDGCQRCADAAGNSTTVHHVAANWRRLERRLPGPLAVPLGRLARGWAARQADPDAASQALAKRSTHVRAMATNVDLFLTPSQTLHDRFLAFGIPPERLRRVDQGIAQDRLREVGASRRAEPGDEKSPLRIGFLGSLIVSKAPHLLLEAFAALRREVGDFARLEIYGGFAPYHGDASYLERLEPLLDQPGVRHHGPVPHAEVPRALASVDVMVLPSVWLENAPFSIREANVSGVPVVASRLGGMAEMVRDGVDGLLFEPGDAGDLYRVLRRLVDEPGLLDQLRQGQPSRMTIEEDAQQILALYHEALAKRAVDPAPAQPERPQLTRPQLTRPQLAAVVLNFRTPRDTILAVRSLASSKRRVDDILVVENGSGDDSLDVLQAEIGSMENLEILDTGRNLGFSGGVNVGIRAALERGAERVFLLNSDALVDAECLGRLEDALHDEGTGIAGPAVLAAQDPRLVASTGIGFGRWSGRMRHRDAGAPFHFASPPANVEVPAVAGCAMLIDRRVLDQVGLFDEDYFFSFEDLDYCLRARRAGFATRQVGDALAYHQGCRSIGPTSPRRLYFAARNHLLAARRAAPLPPPLSWLRAKLIIGWNVAFALRGSGTPRGVALAAVARGVVDHLRGRYGADA